MQIEPATKIVQPHFGSQTSLKSLEVVRTLTRQTKGIQEFGIGRFDESGLLKRSPEVASAGLARLMGECYTCLNSG
jgi:hypothetical protein